MKSASLIGIGALIALVGVVWTLQGLGYIGDSVMSGVTLWAVVGPIVAVIGIAVAAAGFGRVAPRRRGSERTPTQRQKRAVRGSIQQPVSGVTETVLRSARRRQGRLPTTWDAAEQKRGPVKGLMRC